MQALETSGLVHVLDLVGGAVVQASRRAAELAILLDRAENGRATEDGLALVNL